MHRDFNVRPSESPAVCGRMEPDVFSRPELNFDCLVSNSVADELFCVTLSEASTHNLAYRVQEAFPFSWVSAADIVRHACLTPVKSIWEPRFPPTAVAQQIIYDRNSLGSNVNGVTAVIVIRALPECR